ncbi:MAG: hypothetical protein JWN48_3870 [Myxococcaceae bacterium]|nr:hypothetical protein [Myxococcaceae bacterium]
MALRLRVAGGLGLALLSLSLGSCLVTENHDLPAPSDVPVVRRISPPVITRVPSVTDPDCSGVVPSELAMQFKVNVQYEDTTSDLLFLQIFVNGNAQQIALQTLRHNNNSQTRVPTPICLSQLALNAGCNLVQVAVATDTDKLLRADTLSDPAVAVAEWFVLGSSTQQPDAQFESDCRLLLNPDGGV